MASRTICIGCYRRFRPFDAIMTQFQKLLLVSTPLWRSWEGWDRERSGKKRKAAKNIYAQDSLCRKQTVGARWNVAIRHSDFNTRQFRTLSTYAYNYLCDIAWNAAFINRYRSSMPYWSDNVLTKGQLAHAAFTTFTTLVCTQPVAPPHAYVCHTCTICVLYLYNMYIITSNLCTIPLQCALHTYTLCRQYEHNTCTMFAQYLYRNARSWGSCNDRVSIYMYIQYIYIYVLYIFFSLNSTLVNST